MLTEEQQQVVACDAPLLSVAAFAGAGKTTTLLQYARARPKSKILYLAFNRSVAEEAKQRMPRNVRVATSHALAWRDVARAWDERKLRSKFGAAAIAQHFEHHAALKDSYRKWARASFIAQKINDYCQSRAQDVSAAIYEDDEDLSRLGWSREEAVELLRQVWQRATDARDPMPATHDMYFKLWQLGRPQLPFDVVLLDEAQDTNAALLDVFMRQEHATRVLVGDTHQSIYGFRGAVNAMEKLSRNAAQLALTHSFRFGQPVADVANAILHTFKGEQRRLIGAAAHASVVGRDAAKPSEMTTAVLFRTNAGLFSAAARMCSKGSASFSLLGDFESYPFDDILDTYWLKSRKISEIRSPYIRSFGTFEKLVEYTEATDDQEMRVRLKVLDEWGNAIPDVYRRVRASITAGAPLQLTTAHKSKGSEWDQVIIADDYPALMGQEAPRCARYVTTPDEGNILRTEEANLWYVAVTRARHRLVVSQELEKFLLFSAQAGSKQRH